MSSEGDGVHSPPVTDLSDYQHLQKTLRYVATSDTDTNSLSNFTFELNTTRPDYRLQTSAANRLIGEVVQSRRRPLLVGAFNQEKALLGAFSVNVKTGCGTDGSFYSTTTDTLY